jgi:hypothetical protein
MYLNLNLFLDLSDHSKNGWVSAMHYQLGFVYWNDWELPRRQKLFYKALPQVITVWQEVAELTQQEQKVRNIFFNLGISL